MNEPKICTVCGVLLVGPFEPAIPLNRYADGAEDGDRPVHSVTAQSWLCPACGLLAWYAPAEELDEGEQALARPGQPYERRAQILRMLRRVRRM